MKTIIIEDEKPAAEKLRKILMKYDSSINVLVTLDSIASATEWLSRNAAPDLIFMDIELSDGLSFKIFETHPLYCPIIFTTAYDEYWQEALEQNSIDYLLKPIRQEKLENALNKYKKLKQHFSSNYLSVFQQFSANNKQAQYRKRFLLKKGTELVGLKTEDIAYCYAAHKIVFIIDNKAQRYILDRSLNDLEKELDPVIFFRINRKYLVNMHHIQRIKTYAKSKLMVELNPPAGEDIVVSQENAMAFKQWMDN
ncbi:MAG: response regulator transcription factor [Bacteroidetes bacterium]|nr:response regulator transcription factor [Bacteroidota bacterium]